MRLQRYILLLDNLLRKTPEDHEDRPHIEATIDVIKKQCKDANLSVELQQAKLNLVRLSSEIVVKPDTLVSVPKAFVSIAPSLDSWSPSYRTCNCCPRIGNCSTVARWSANLTGVPLCQNGQS